jgi:energy-converting hydrogenase Eha subunit E
MLRLVLALQAAYYCATGLWPWISMGTFEAVTGPKTDDWLVQTVGALVVAIGLALGVAAWKRERSAAVLTLAGASAAAFIIVDVTFVASGTIRPIYLADAVAEAVILAGLALGAGRRRPGSSPIGTRTLL